MEDKKVRINKIGQAILEATLVTAGVLLLFAGVLSLWRSAGYDYLLRLSNYKKERVDEINARSQSLNPYAKYITSGSGTYDIPPFYLPSDASSREKRRLELLAEFERLEDEIDELVQGLYPLHLQARNNIKDIYSHRFDYSYYDTAISDCKQIVSKCNSIIEKYTRCIEILEDKDFNFISWDRDPHNPQAAENAGIDLDATIKEIVNDPAFEDLPLSSNSNIGQYLYQTIRRIYIDNYTTIKGYIERIRKNAKEAESFINNAWRNNNFYGIWHWYWYRCLNKARQRIDNSLDMLEKQ